MMRRSHGPTLKKHMIRLAECPACQGKGIVQGVFHELACDACSASGWVDRWTGQALPLAELVVQLGMNLRAATKQIEQINCFKPAGAEAQYNENNRRGPGATNFTGD